MAYLTESERQRIEIMLENGYTQREIARRLSRHYNTINREIKRGLVTLRDGHSWKDYTVYKSDVGQRKHRECSSNKGAPLKIGNDMDFVRFAEHMILDMKYSPYAVIQAAKGKFRTQVCKTTLYSYIDKGVFLNVSNKDLPIKKHARQNAYKPLRRGYNSMRGKSIEERPKPVNDRVSYGHWEMDTVVGGRGKSPECLLVLTERSRRDELILKMKDKTCQSVINALDRLEKIYGLDGFRNRFLSITVDNGSEFLDSTGIERSIHGGSRTSLYYCHPYCSFERGSNENANKLIRRFCPKGCDFADYSDKDIQFLEEWINSYPRQLFGGMSSRDVSL